MVPYTFFVPSGIRTTRRRWSVLLPNAYTTQATTAGFIICNIDDHFDEFWINISKEEQRVQGPILLTFCRLGLIKTRSIRPVLDFFKVIIVISIFILVLVIIKVIRVLRVRNNIIERCECPMGTKLLLLFAPKLYFKQSKRIPSFKRITRGLKISSY